MSKQGNSIRTATKAASVSSLASRVDWNSAFDVCCHCTPAAAALLPRRKKDREDNMSTVKGHGDEYCATMGTSLSKVIMLVGGDESPCELPTVVKHPRGQELPQDRTMPGVPTRVVHIRRLVQTVI